MAPADDLGLSSQTVVNWYSIITGACVDHKVRSSVEKLGGHSRDQQSQVRSQEVQPRSRRRQGQWLFVWFEGGTSAHMKTIDCKWREVRSNVPVSYTHLDVYKRQFKVIVTIYF